MGDACSVQTNNVLKGLYLQENQEPHQLQSWPWRTTRNHRAAQGADLEVNEKPALLSGQATLTGSALKSFLSLGPFGDLCMVAFLLSHSELAVSVLDPLLCAECGGAGLYLVYSLQGATSRCEGLPQRV